MAVMRKHSVVGERICAPLKSVRYVLPIIRHHHEKSNGSGYPDGLRGEEIPLTARILQLADVYDALTTDRPYRKADPSEVALALMDEPMVHAWMADSVKPAAHHETLPGRWVAEPSWPPPETASADLHVVRLLTGPVYCNIFH